MCSPRISETDTETNNLSVYKETGHVNNAYINPFSGQKVTEFAHVTCDLFRDHVNVLGDDGLQLVKLYISHDYACNE